MLVANSNGTFTVAGIDHTNVINSQPVIQAAIDRIYNDYGGGHLWLPRPGMFRLNSGIVLKGGVKLFGHNKEKCILFGQHADIDTLTLDASCRYAGASDLFVAGYSGQNPTKNAVTIAANVPAQFERCNLWGGLSALKNSGVDGEFYGCFIAGNANAAACVTSNGANWYERCKIDTAGFAVTNAFVQGTGAIPGVMENHFTDCDFSGTFTRSVLINDGATNTAITVFTGGVFSSPVVITNHHSSIFTGCEFGSTFSTPGNTTVTGCVKLGSAMTAGNAAKAGNVNIS